MQRDPLRSRPSAEGDPMQRLLLGLGLVLLAASGAHLVLWLGTGESLAGPHSIRRPILFFFSSGLLALTFGWTLPQLRLGRRPVSERRIRALGLGFLALLPGLSMIGLQYWRGAESHFHGTTWIDLLSNALSFGAALAYTVVAFELTRLLWRSGGRDDGLGWGLRLGWSLHLIATVCVGWALGANEGTLGPRQDALFRMHALGAHSVQLFPLLAWLLARAGLERSAILRRLGWALAGAGLWIAGWTWLAWRPLAVAEAPPAVVLVLGAALAIGLGLIADLLRRTRALLARASRGRPSWGAEPGR